MNPPENVLLSCESRLLRERLKERLTSSDLGDLDESHVEFDGWSYTLQCPKDGDIMLLAMALPAGLTSDQKQIFLSAAGEIFHLQYEGVAKVMRSEAGHDVTLAIDLHALRARGLEDQEAWVAALASARSLLMGIPLRSHFLRWSSGQAQSQQPKVIYYRPGAAYIITPQSSSMTLSFPIHMMSQQDATLASELLQEMADTRRLANVGPLAAAPLCSYTPFRPQGATVSNPVASPCDPLTCPNAGTISFTFLPEHVVGPQVENILWTMSSFPAWVKYQVSATKAWMHNDMRQRVSTMATKLVRLPPGPWESQRTLRRNMEGRFTAQTLTELTGAQSAPHSTPSSRLSV